MTAIFCCSLRFHRLNPSVTGDMLCSIRLTILFAYVGVVLGRVLPSVIPDVGFLKGVLCSHMPSVAPVYDRSDFLPGEVPVFPPTEMLVLQEFYNATHGDEWMWRLNGSRWDFAADANPCVDHWQGLNCTLVAAEGYFYISQLELPCYGLNGTIPETIAELQGLEILVLGGNRLSGTIPATIVEMPYLGVIVLLNNTLTGPIPPGLGNLPYLLELSLGDNYLNGTIPETLGNLASLHVLGLESNALSGTIPSALGSLYELLALQLAGNYLFGHIPPSIGNIPYLSIIALGYNYLSGPIPSTFGNLLHLRRFSLEINLLSGQIPSSLGNLQNVAVMNLGINRLTGTIPPALGNMAGLRELDVNNNTLNGTIPATLGQLTKMQIMALDLNYLTGRIPPALGNCSHMRNLGFVRNRLEGPIPSSFSNFTHLRQFACGINLLTGPIPAFFTSFSELRVFDLNNNSLTGQIPDDIGRLGNLREFGFRLNKLTGSLPESLGDLSNLQLADLDDNSFTGTLPAVLGNLLGLTDIYIFNNLLTGTIPDSIGNLKELVCFDVNRNFLSGTIPKSFANLSAMQTLVLNSNFLSGTLDSVFDPGNVNLVSIQVNTNQLTGTLPDELFLLPMLNTFVAGKNCFHGTLPSTVCAMKTIQTFVLNGLSSSSACRNEFFHGTSAYALTNAVHGTIPTCMLSLPKLNTLHLSGNGFTGSLPDNVSISAALFDLTLSHNILKGKVPAQVQRRAWYNLDLSYNRFSGTLLSDFGTIGAEGELSESVLPNRSVSLENNRISGQIPGEMQNFVNISILGTNLFSCNLDESDLPAHDSGKDNYECGSTSFDVPYYLWMCIVFVMLTTLGLMLTYKIAVGPITAALLNKWLALVHVDEKDKRMLAFADYLEVVHGFCRIALTVAAFSVAVLLPVYASVGHYYSTVTHQYAWLVSSTYVSGSVPVAVELPLWILLLGLVVCLADTYLRRLTAPTSEIGTREYIIFPSRRSAFGQFAYVSINICVVVGVNILYVYIAIYKSTALLVFAQVLLSFFKVSWNSFLTSYLLEWTVPSTAQRSAGSQFFTMQVIVALLNNIVIPCFVVACISPNCFYNVFASAPAVDLQYVYTECNVIFLFTGRCVQSIVTTHSSSYDPPFTYSYQCSSSFITYYAPAFVNLCIVSTVVTPTIQMIWQWLHTRATPGTLWFEALDYALPRNLKPLPAVHAETEEVEYHSILQGSQVLVTMVVYVGLLLTFGVMFPPLAVALAVTLFSAAYFAKLKVGRYLVAAKEAGRLPEMLLQIEHECQGIKSSAVLYKSVWLLSIVSCWFYTLFLFDTLGDAVGFNGSYWLIAVVPQLPLVLYATYRIYALIWPIDLLIEPSHRRTSVHAEMELKPTSIDAKGGDNATFNVLQV